MILKFCRQPSPKTSLSSFLKTLSGSYFLINSPRQNDFSFLLLVESKKSLSKTFPVLFLRILEFLSILDLLLEFSWNRGVTSFTVIELKGAVGTVSYTHLTLPTTPYV